MPVPVQDFLPIQNLGLFDRILRVVGASVIFAWVISSIASGSHVNGWQALLMLLAIYPFMTGMLGYGPFYAALGVRSCSLEGRNRCGSFPAEVMAFFKEAPGRDHSTHQ